MLISQNMLETIKKIVVDDLQRLRIEPDSANIYVYCNSLPKTNVMNYGDRERELTRETALILVDLAPLYNWGHPCIIQFFDVETNEIYESIQTNMPPDSFWGEREKYEAIHAPVQFPNEEWAVDADTPEDTSALNDVLATVAGNKYAILFSGASENRHLNDMEFLYRTLIDVYKFPVGNITVLNFNGKIDYNGNPKPVKNWPGNNTPYRIKINGPGTKASLLSAFDSLKGKLRSGDLLLLHTNNHGYRSSESYLVCQPSPHLNPSELGKKLAELPSIGSLIVMMEQCFSGGFKDVVIKNAKANLVSFAAACDPDKSSMGGPIFDPFALDWIAAVTGKYPNSSLKKTVPNPPSMKDCFTYAHSVKDKDDTPVYSDKPSNGGVRQNLK